MWIALSLFLDGASYVRIFVAKDKATPQYITSDNDTCLPYSPNWEIDCRLYIHF
jgi:hypothetical protein